MGRYPPITPTTIRISEPVFPAPGGLVFWIFGLYICLKPLDYFKQKMPKLKLIYALPGCLICLENVWIWLLIGFLVLGFAA
jgi:hypothetical protein